jgi:hypothetical protein
LGDGCPLKREVGDFGAQPLGFSAILLMITDEVR